MIRTYVIPTITVPAGTLVVLAEGDWQYGTGPLHLKITDVRNDLSWAYEGRKVWLEGERLTVEGHSLGRFQALVSVPALRHALAKTGQHPSLADLTVE